MKTKLLSILLVQFFALSAFAQNNVITYTANSKLAETNSTSGKGIYIYGFGGRVVSSHTFSNGIGTITFYGEVTKIDYETFSHCDEMTSITLPNSVTNIGDLAFAGCSGLTSITIGNGVTSIGKAAFSRCSGLTRVDYNGDIAQWCGITFNDSQYGYPLETSNPLWYAHDLYINNQKIENLVIPSGVTSIGHYAFSGCSSLTSVTIPNSVTSIGDNAFQNCSGLTSVTIPDGITSIGDAAFYGCSHLRTIHAHLTTLPSFAYDVFANVPTSAILYVPTESKSLYQAHSNWNRFTTIRELHDVTVGDAEWASLCLPYNAEIPAEVTVYQGEVGNGYVSLTEIEQNNMLPANTGCVINAPAGTYTFLQTTETPTAVQNNDIHGVTADTEYSSLYDVQTETLLTLGLDDDDNVGFHRPNTTYSPQLEAYKAYILYPGVAQAPLRILMPGESNPIATGVEQTLSGSPLKGEGVKAMLNGQLVIVRGGHYYDLNGKIYE